MSAAAAAADDAADLGISLAQKMLSAVTGSVLTSLLVTPLDVVRVRLQSQHPTPAPHSRPFSSTLPLPQFRELPPNLGISACCREVFWINNNAPYCVVGPTVSPINPANAACAVEETERTTINSTLDGLRKIARNEGARTLWRGLSPTLAMAVPANVIYFAGYDWLRAAPGSPFQNVVPDAYVPLAAGGSARVLAAAAVGPIEIFRTRMQAARTTSTAGHFRETLDGLRELVAAEGIRSLWRGLTLTLWRDVPFSAIYWWGYETNRNMLTDIRGRAEAKKDGLEFAKGAGVDKVRRRSRSRSQENHTAALVDSFVAGATSGAVAALVTTPFDVGKTRRQVLRHTKDTINLAGGAMSSSVVRPEDKSMPRFLWHIFKEEGVPGLFRGWTARCLKVAPACAIMISSYEVGKKMANDINERRGKRRNGE